jgi:hypothetical protein
MSLKTIATRLQQQRGAKKPSGLKQIATRVQQQALAKKPAKPAPKPAPAKPAPLGLRDSQTGVYAAKNDRSMRTKRPMRRVFTPTRKAK